MNKIKTLSASLTILIERHTLYEVIDRLNELCYHQSEGDRVCQHEWEILLEHLEKATESALKIAELKEENNQDFWLD